ncbi:TMV resistance protein N-like isoform X3 [Prosopis cineraria]|uniref:TMV resistance protein N-like isoform X3 n=1 Tax=Prosopis cineraria TaxID=364024 RepID=UPI00240FADFF|nr:TMV resistance protein N-like isoform X3 [Prosopis cineraria]XP_054780097.1 TMV resistance protein N-like isoform X3 [Prosopis cineraria]XP_054780098.1 TMV resistance protein N-like isoform X3 [Prosopis cineraria]
MAASASSSQVKHDVFISFRGSDIRSGFLSHLKKELRRKQVDVYVDDRLERGDEISSALDEAIEGSMIALVIFSKEYASSKWCLQELVKIMERKETSQQIVIPIFYYVPPTDVRNQTGAYAESFNDHEQRFKDNMDKLKIWRSVLTKTANLSGHDSPNFQDESELIDAIVMDVLKKLKVDNHSVPTSQLVGSHENLGSVESLMEINESQEVRFIGIWGMGGIGKTTLAREIYNRFSSEFGSHCFLDKVREESTGITSLYGKLLYELFGEKDLHKNMNDAKRRLQRVKALIVLDDVDNPSQLKGAGQILINLGLGSRVIVTSRDKHVLRSGRIDEKYIHEVKGLKFDESLELFSSHAFDQSYPKVGYEELSKMIVHNLAKGNPLALEVLGSHFHSRDEVYWKSELDKLKTCPHRGIQDILRVSYDGLDDMDKEIFLDIAFFFVGEKKIALLRC